MSKKILSLLLILILAVSMMPCSFAWYTEDDDYIGSDISLDEAVAIAQSKLDRDAGKDLAQIASENSAIVWHYNPYGDASIPEPVLQVSEGEEFDEIVSALFEKYEVGHDLENTYRSHITLGYLNLVTGEEHYYGENTTLVSASIFKIPENMILCDMISNGELDYETEINGEPYKFHQYRTISRSDNDSAMVLMNYIGGYIRFKQFQRPFIGDEPYADGVYIDGTEMSYTPREVISALKNIYENPEKYNGILQNMLQAQPYQYFKMFERDFAVAQKYGFLSQNEATGDHTYINCCAVVYTDEPIAIVCMTDNISKAYNVIGEYACLASQYAQQNTRPAVEETPEPTPVQETAPVPTSVVTQPPDNINIKTEKDNKMSLSSCIVIGLVLILMLYFLVAVFRRNAGGEVNGVWMVLAILTASLAMILCVIASQRGTLYAKPAGDPGDTVSLFYTSLKNQDYTTAYDCLEEYSDLGLEKEGDSEESRMMQQALRSSYDYALQGLAQTDKLSAKQNMMFRYLDLNAVESAAMGNVESCLKQIVDERSYDELYDENNQFLTSVTDEVYSLALQKALENPENYYKTVDLTIDLDYVNGRWLIRTSDEMLYYILGGVSK